MGGPRTPRNLADERQQDLDAQIETLARQLAEVINGAGSEERQGLREYALGLIKEETEVIEAPSASSNARSTADTNPLAMALLLGVMAIPMGILFPFVGVTMMVISLVLGVTGVIMSIFRR